MRWERHHLIRFHCQHCHKFYFSCPNLNPRGRPCDRCSPSSMVGEWTTRLTKRARVRHSFTTRLKYSCETCEELLHIPPDGRRLFYHYLWGDTVLCFICLYGKRRSEGSIRLLTVQLDFFLGPLVSHGKHGYKQNSESRTSDIYRRMW